MLASFLKRDLRNLFRKDASPNFQAQNGLLSLRSRWRSVRSLEILDEFVYKALRNSVHGESWLFGRGDRPVCRTLVHYSAVILRPSRNAGASSSGRIAGRWTK